jgi:ribosome-associated protein
MRHDRVSHPWTLAVEAALEKKAERPVVLDLREIGSITDYFIVCHGRSTRQVQAIADRIEEVLKSAGIAPNHIEGYDAAEWILMDFVDFVAHIFLEDTRNYYSLEKLWSDAPRLEIPAPTGRAGTGPSGSQASDTRPIL